ncbi:hypothetical protein LGN57_20945, partial [Escherichia coli]|uniref:hypothetical protein n=1 Tax=Escherichia coli TaxID=562 RepID=UPI001CF5A51E
ADRNRSHWSTSKTPSYTKSVSWQHHREYGTAEFCAAAQIIVSGLFATIPGTESHSIQITTTVICGAKA